MKTTLILIVIYLASVLITWNFMKIAHGKKGIWYNLDTGSAELLLTFMPLINTVFCFMYLPSGPYRDSNSNFNKFFKVKK